MKTGDDEMGRYGGSMYFTGYRSAETWASMGLIGDRLSFTDDEVITKLGLGYIQNPSAECAMDTAIRYELLNAGQDGEISAKQMLNHRTKLAALIEAGIVADGWYRDDEGAFQRDWVFDERFVRLHYNSISGSYGYKQTHFAAGLLEEEKELKLYKKYGLREGDYWYYGEVIETIQGPLQTKPVKGNERMLTHVMDDKETLRYINKALNRMVKSEKAVQVTKGRGRTFRWDAWQWLDTVRNRHLVSESKKRKVGDTVNGWIYTQGNTTMHFGVPVHQHWWQPVEAPKLYFVYLNSKRVGAGSYYSGWKPTTQDDSCKLPYFFTSKSEAFELCNRLNEQMSLRVDPSNFLIKYIDDDFNVTTDEPQFAVSSLEYDYRIDMNAVVEDYDEPLTAHLALMTKGNDNYNELKKLYTDCPNNMMFVKKVTNKGDDE
tara:strand:- start:7176 stop:8468 length:1293 start_codon:yes stop_codon:yes gene_type:complete